MATDPSPSLLRLHNEDWGFESSCFVCEPRNDAGLQIPFHHDTGRDVVVGSFNLGNAFSGAPTYVHGGIVLAVLDEAMAWAAIAVAHKFAVTAETTTQFTGPVRVGRPYVVEAHLTSRTEDRLAAAAVVRDGDGAVCAEATATFVILGSAQAVDATGVDASALDPAYLR